LVAQDPQELRGRNENEIIKVAFMAGLFELFAELCGKTLFLRVFRGFTVIALVAANTRL